MTQTPDETVEAVMRRTALAQGLPPHQVLGGQLIHEGIPAISGVTPLRLFPTDLLEGRAVGYLV